MTPEQIDLILKRRQIAIDKKVEKIMKNDQKMCKKGFVG